MELLPDAGLLPVAQAPLARHPTAAEFGQQHLPGDAALEHEQDASQRYSFVDWPGCLKRRKGLCENRGAISVHKSSPSRGLAITLSRQGKRIGQAVMVH